MNNEDQVSLISNLAIFATIIAAFISGGVALNDKKYYLLIFTVLCLAACILISYVSKGILDNINYERFKRHWGNFEKRKRNFKTTQNFFEIDKQDEEKFSVDEQTWSDLNMDKLFELIDRTITSPGEEMLYKILKQPELSAERLIDRNKVINLLKDNANVRNKIGLELTRLGREKDNGAFGIISKDFNLNYKYKYLFNFLVAAFLLSIVSIPILGIQSVIVTLALFVANSIMHNKFKSNVESYVNSLGYLNGIINTANRLSKINDEELKHYTEILNKTYKACKVVAKETSGMHRVEGLDPIGDLFYMLFLVEERKFFSSINDIKKYRNELKELYKTLGELDALMSVASFREWLGEDYTEPEFVTEGKVIEAVEVFHPLIDEAVGNTITLNDEGIILTGTNMSGKSTFLRTIGANALLAQTIYTCAADSYRTSFFKIMTSISPEDNISSGKSYYFREAEALKRIINECNSEVPVLCIIDEIFRGTNPVERVNASAEILNYISKHNTLTLVATHDLELTEILKDKYLCYYFTEDINEEGLNFDYKIKNGVCRNRNAVKLLKYLEYPEEIIQKTNERLSKLI